MIRLARILKFQLKQEEVLDYRGSKNKSAYQRAPMRRLSAHLLFAYGKKRFSYDMAHVFFTPAFE